MTDRERFEAWAASFPYELGDKLGRFDENGTWPGQYSSYHVQFAWEAWQAGQQHLQRKVAHGCTDANCEECDK